MIPGRIISELVAGLSRGVERHQHLSGVVLSISRHGFTLDARALQSVERAVAELVDADRTRHPRVGAERGGVTGKIRGRSAKSRYIRINVPQHFADPRDHQPARHASTPSWR